MPAKSALMLGMDIGASIKKLRLGRNLTQEELAERANTSKPNISNLERNAQGFSPVILSSLGKAFGLKGSEIFRLAEELGDAGNGCNADAAIAIGIAAPRSDELLELYAEQTQAKQQAALLRFMRDWAESDGPR